MEEPKGYQFQAQKSLSVLSLPSMPMNGTDLASVSVENRDHFVALV